MTKARGQASKHIIVPRSCCGVILTDGGGGGGGGGGWLRGYQQYYELSTGHVDSNKRQPSIGVVESILIGAGVAVRADSGSPKREYMSDKRHPSYFDRDIQTTKEPKPCLRC